MPKPINTPTRKISKTSKLLLTSAQMGLDLQDTTPDNQANAEPSSQEMSDPWSPSAAAGRKNTFWESDEEKEKEDKRDGKQKLADWRRAHKDSTLIKMDYPMEGVETTENKQNVLELEEKPGTITIKPDPNPENPIDDKKSIPLAYPGFTERSAGEGFYGIVGDFGIDSQEGQDSQEAVFTPTHSPQGTPSPNKGHTKDKKSPTTKGEITLIQKTSFHDTSIEHQLTTPPIVMESLKEDTILQKVFLSFYKPCHFPHIPTNPVEIWSISTYPPYLHTHPTTKPLIPPPTNINLKPTNHPPMWYTILRGTPIFPEKRATNLVLYQEALYPDHLTKTTITLTHTVIFNITDEAAKTSDAKTSNQPQDPQQKQTKLGPRISQQPQMNPTTQINPTVQHNIPKTTTQDPHNTQVQSAKKHLTVRVYRADDKGNKYDKEGTLIDRHYVARRAFNNSRTNSIRISEAQKESIAKGVPITQVRNDNIEVDFSYQNIEMSVHRGHNIELDYLYQNLETFTYHFKSKLLTVTNHEMFNPTTRPPTTPPYQQPLNTKPQTPLSSDFSIWLHNQTMDASNSFFDHMYSSHTYHVIHNQTLEDAYLLFYFQPLFTHPHGLNQPEMDLQLFLPPTQHSPNRHKNQVNQDLKDFDHILSQIQYMESQHTYHTPIKPTHDPSEPTSIPDSISPPHPTQPSPQNRWPTTPPQHLDLESFTTPSPQANQDDSIHITPQSPPLFPSPTPTSSQNHFNNPLSWPDPRLYPNKISKTENNSQHYFSYTQEHRLQHSQVPRQHAGDEPHTLHKTTQANMGYLLCIKTHTQTQTTTPYPQIPEYQPHNKATQTPQPTPTTEATTPKIESPPMFRLPKMKGFDNFQPTPHTSTHSIIAPFHIFPKPEGKLLVTLHNIRVKKEPKPQPPDNPNNPPFVSDSPTPETPMPPDTPKSSPTGTATPTPLSSPPQGTSTPPSQNSPPSQHTQDSPPSQHNPPNNTLTPPSPHGKSLSPKQKRKHGGSYETIVIQTVQNNSLQVTGSAANHLDQQQQAAWKESKKFSELASRYEARAKETQHLLAYSISPPWAWGVQDYPQGLKANKTFMHNVKAIRTAAMWDIVEEATKCYTQTKQDYIQQGALAMDKLLALKPTQIAMDEAMAITQQHGITNYNKEIEKLQAQRATMEKNQPSDKEVDEWFKFREKHLPPARWTTVNTSDEEDHTTLNPLEQNITPPKKRVKKDNTTTYPQHKAKYNITTDYKIPKVNNKPPPPTPPKTSTPTNQDSPTPSDPPDQDPHTSPNNNNNNFGGARRGRGDQPGNRGNRRGGGGGYNNPRGGGNRGGRNYSNPKQVQPLMVESTPYQPQYAQPPPPQPYPAPQPLPQPYPAYPTYQYPPNYYPQVPAPVAYTYPPQYPPQPQWQNTQPQPQQFRGQSNYRGKKPRRGAR